MVKYLKFLLVISVLIVALQPAVLAQSLSQQFEVLVDYGLMDDESINGDRVDQLGFFQGLMSELEQYSSSKNLFLDLIDTLKNYSQDRGLAWQREDLHRVAWAIKYLDWELYQKGNYDFQYSVGGSFQMEVFHSHGANLYKDPYRHDIDGDGLVDRYEEDEYLRQGLNLQLSYSNPRMDAGLTIQPALNYFGTGYFQDGDQYQRAFDLSTPFLHNPTIAFYGPRFSSVIGEEQILGIRDYLYYDDPTEIADYNLSGITFQTPFGLIFGVGQETLENLVTPEKTHDIRWIALGMERFGSLPLGFYMAEQEYQSHDFRKIGRNVVFALMTDFDYQGVEVTGDLAINDVADGFYGQLTGETELNGLQMGGKVEKAEHFTAIQPIPGFANTEHTRGLKNGEKWTLPARTKEGIELWVNRPLREGLNWYGSLDHYLTGKMLVTGLEYQPVPGLTLDVQGRYDYLWDDQYSLQIDATYDHQYGNLIAEKNIGGTGEIRLKAEPTWQNEQVTMKGIFDYSWLDANQKNSETGIDIIYHPIQDFTFTAKYRIEDKDYNVDLPGLNFRRIGSLKYQINEWAAVDITFENIEFRHELVPYLVEYTKGNLEFRF